METLIYSLTGVLLTFVLTLAILNLSPLKFGGLLAFFTLVVFTFLSPFLSYLFLVVAKPVIDSLYRFYIGPLKITHVFSVYATVIWTFFLAFRRRITPPFISLDVVQPLFVLPALFSLLFIPNLGGLGLFFMLISGLGFYYMMRELPEERRRYFETAYLLSGVFPASAGLLGLAGVVPDAFHSFAFPRLRAVYYDATAFGFELVPPFIVLISRLGRRFSIPEFAYLLLILFLLYKTYTRSLWLGVFTVIFVSSLWRSREVKHRWAYVLVLMAITLISLLFWKEISLRFSQNAFGTDPESFNGRMMIWKKLFSSYASLPFLHKFFGIITTGYVPASHNVFVSFLTIWGVLGFSVFLVWLVCVFRLLLGYRGSYSHMLVSTVIFLLLSGMTSDSFFYPNFQWFVMGVLGLAAGDHIRTMRSGEKPRRFRP